MNKIEEKVFNKYKRHITKIIKNKYLKKAKQEAKNKRFYLEAGGDMRKKLDDTIKQIYKTYSLIIEEEISCKLESFIKSDKFKQLVEAEKKVKKLNYKSLKKYQEFRIGFNNYFLDKMFEEVNKDSENIISKEEIKYILLLTFYKIIDYLKQEYLIKIGTILKIWLVKRDVRINLPFITNRILEDRYIPKVALCKSFDYKLFHKINEENSAIINYYKAKSERFLMLLKIKSGKNE